MKTKMVRVFSRPFSSLARPVGEARADKASTVVLVCKHSVLPFVLRFFFPGVKRCLFYGDFIVSRLRKSSEHRHWAKKKGKEERKEEESIMPAVKSPAFETCQAILPVTV